MPDTDYNLYFTDGAKSWYRDGKDYNSLSAWSATKGMPDQHSLFANPRFVKDPASAALASVPINLRPDSPAINRGTSIEMQTQLPFVDYFGKSRVDQPDIGAFELQK